MIRVRRVHWWTDRSRLLRHHLREALRALGFGCWHETSTIRFERVPDGTWFVNRCHKCGETKAHGWYHERASSRSEVR